MARPRKVVDISTGKIGKQARVARQVAESKIKIDRKQLETGAPSWLSDGAAQEYNRVVREAGKIGLLDNLDMVVLAIYADNYARRKAMKNCIASSPQPGMMLHNSHSDKTKYPGMFFTLF